MEDKKLNEKESLELIAQMIQNTRRNLDEGSGNMFLVWGYVSVVVTLTVLAGLYFTKNPVWMWGFWALPVLGYPLTYIILRKHHTQVKVKEYTDSVLNDAWCYVGMLCMVFVIGAAWTKNFEVILPVCAILIPVGTIFTGAVIRVKSFYIFSGLAIVLGMCMFFDAWKGNTSYPILVEFAVVLLLATIIPGHILNYKARKEAASRK